MLSEAGHWVCCSGATGADEYEMLPVTGPVQPVWSYKVTHSLWLPLLGLGVWGKDQASLQGQILPAPGPGADQQRSQDTPRSASTCLHLSSESLKEPLAVLELREVASQ